MTRVQQPPWGELSAVNANTGEIAWKTEERDGKRRYVAARLPETVSEEARAALRSYVFDRTRDRGLRLWRLLPRPGQIQDGPGAVLGDFRGEEPHVFVIADRVLERQSGLLLQHDVVPCRGCESLLCRAGIPVPPQTRSAGHDGVGFQARASRPMKPTRRSLPGSTASAASPASSPSIYSSARSA